MFLGKKKNLFVLVLLLATFFIFAPDAVFAQVEFDPTETQTGDALVTTPFDPAGTFIYKSLTTIGGLVAWLGGTLLNISLSMFVFNLPRIAEILGLMEVTSYVWEFTRDLFNLFFIFGLTLIGFKFILGLDVNGAKRNLGTILIAALLINFSLYATKLIIDIGNVAAAEIGDLFSPADGSPTQNLFGIEIIDISGSFVAVSDISSISNNTLALSSYAATGVETDTGTETELGVADALGMGLTIAVLLILMGFVFAAGAFLMLARFFYLIFLMMFSPIMFLGFVLPKMQGISKGWWERLFSQTIVGPAYLFMLLIAVRALDTLVTTRSKDEISTWGFIISSILVAGFVWASLVVAKKFGGVGASTAMNIGSGAGRSIRGFAGRTAGGATFGAVGGFLRGNVGRRMQEYAESDKAKGRAANSFLGRRALNISRKLGDASFDARQVGGVGKKIGLGEGAKGGYKTATESIAKREKEYGDSLGKVSDEDPAVASLLLDIEASTVAINKKKQGIQKLRIDGASQEDIEKEKALLEELEYKQTKQKESLETERYRNQIGKVTQTDYQKDEVNRIKGLIETRLTEYADGAKTKEEKENLARAIANNKKELAELEKREGGYANSVENKNLISNIFQGRDWDGAQNKNAAEEIRKAYKDKVKSKDKAKDRPEAKAA